MRISVLFCAAAAIVGTAFAQQAASSKFVLSESSSSATSLATLCVASDGSVTGTSVVQPGGQIVTYALQGVLTTNEDGSKVLTLNGTSTDAVDADGNALVTSETLKLIALPSGGYVALRTDAGQYGYGHMYAAAGSIAAGTYLVNGRAIDPAAVSVDLIDLDAAGNVGGKRVENSFGATVEEPFSGSYNAIATGFYSIQLKVASVDADGNAVTATETYLALATVKDLRMLRVDGASTLLTLTK